MRTPAPGERVGPYVVEGELGRGGMGAVVRARHVETGAVHALKLLLPGALSSWGDSQRVRFAREAEALAALDHPGIVRIHAADLEAARERLARATESERLGPLPLAVFAVEVALLAGDVPGASAHLGAAKRALEAAAKPNPADVALVSYLEAALLLERGDREGADAAGVTGAGQARQSWLPWRSAHEVERALRGEPDPRVWLASGR